MKHSEHVISELEKQIVIKAEHDQLINEMKEKAQQFEQFMINNNNRSPPTKRTTETNTSPSSAYSTDHLRDQCVSTEDLNGNGMQSANSISTSSIEYRTLEKRVREEMSKVMANKIKSYENQIRDESKRFDEEMKEISGQLRHAQSELRSRDNDVSALKQCILSERATIRNVVEKKDLETESAISKHEEMLMDARSELNAARKHIDHLTQELDECSGQFSAERESMEMLVKQLKTERKSMAMRENELKEKLDRMQREHDATVHNLKEKYIAAKKTAANYKKYAEDKERHIQNESERIKMAYETAVKKVKDNMETIVKEQEKQANKRIAQLQTQYEASLTTSSGSSRMSPAISIRSKPSSTT